MVILKVITISLLSVIVLQDFRLKAVTWFLFPMLLLAQVINGLMETGAETYLMDLLLNLSFIAIIMCCTFLYFWLKHKKINSILDEEIGWGDVLFFIILAATFSPVNFIFFTCLSLLLVLIAYLVFSRFKGNANIIPLAGFQALLLMGSIICDIMFENFSLINDDRAIMFIGYILYN